jgi:EmrB/QacA subfamily drug resistance transporter
MDESNEKAMRAWTLALTSVASFIAALDTMVVTTALSTIRRDLGASLEALEWTVNAYTLSFAVLLMTGAALGDRFGRKRMFIGGLALFAAASVACATAAGAGWLIAARACQGAGAALVVPLAMALLSASFPREQRAKALGLYSGVTGLAVFAGPVVGGAIAQSGAWQWIFWLNLPIALCVMALAAARLRESRGPQVPIDGSGLVLVTGAALALVWGLVRANAAGWASVEVASTLAAGLLLAMGFIAWEWRAGDPMVPLRLFRSQAFSAGNAAAFFFSAALYGTLFFLAQFLQTAQGYGPLAAGLRLLPWTATLFVVAPFAGALVNRVGERSLVAGGLFLQACGLAWIAAIAAPELAYARLVLPMIVTGAGLSMAMPAAQNAILGSVSPQEIGKASGTYNMLRFLGAVFGIAILVAVFAARGGYRSAAAFSAGFAPALGVAAAMALVAACAGLALPARASLAKSLPANAAPAPLRPELGKGA